MRGALGEIARFGPGLAGGAPQDCIDQPDLRRAVEMARRFRRRGDRRIGRQTQRVELRQSGQQQAVGAVVAFRQRPGQPGGQHRFITPAVTQGGEADRLEQGAIARVGDHRQTFGQHGFERTPFAQHGRQRQRRLRTQARAGLAHAFLRAGCALR